jgi:CBS domain-containing protein
MESLKDIMQKRVLSVEHSKGLKEVFKKFSTTEFSSIIVTEKKKPIGIITERDIIKKIVLPGKDPKKSKLQDLMTKGLITISINDPMNKAMHLMKLHKVRHLPVLDDGKLVGIITHRNIAGHAEEINWKNVKFMRYQNIQTIIIVLFFIALFVILLLKWLL